MPLGSYRTLTAVLALTAIASSLAIITNLPTETPYSPFNPGPKGTSGIIELLNANLIYGLNELPRDFRGTLILPLTNELSVSDYSVIKSLIDNGTNLIIIDEFGHSNNLLKYLGIRASITNHVVLDEVSKYLSRYYPVIKCLVGGRSLELITYRPTYLEVIDDQYSLLLTTSNYSYADLDGNDYYSLGEVMKPYTVIYRRYLGSGSITIITDLDVVSNELISNNVLVLRELISGPTYLHVGYLSLSSVDYVKHLLTKSPIVKYRGDASSLMTSYVLVATFSYVSYYLSFNGFSKKPLRPYVILNIMYLLAVATYSALVMNDPLMIVPSIINLIACIIRPEFRSPSILTTVIYYSLVDRKLITYLIPLYIVMPYLMSSKPDTSLVNFLGPTTANFIKYPLLMVVTVLVDINSLLAIALMASVAVVNCLIHYLRLYGVRVELLEVPNEVLVRSDASVLLNAYSKSPTYLALVGSDGSKRVLRLAAYSLIKYPLNTQYLGSYSLVINPVVIDDACFSRRLLRPISVKYVVIPGTLKLIESIRSEVFSRADIKELISSVEVGIYELGGLSGLSIDEVSRAVRSLVGRGGLNRVAAEFITSLIEGGEGGEGLGRRSRLGEYLGVRYYLPGDELRSIHWSKSLSKSELIVKEFSTSSTYEGLVSSSGLGPIIIADLTAYSVGELDRLLSALLSAFLGVVRISPFIESSLVIVGGDVILVLRGKALDILYRLYKALSNLMPKVIYDYSPIKSRVDSDYVKYLVNNLGGIKYFSKLVNANKHFSRHLIKVLVMNGLTPPKPCVVIHSDALNVRYALVRYELSNYGYLDIELSRLASYIALGVSR